MFVLGVVVVPTLVVAARWAHPPSSPAYMPSKRSAGLLHLLGAMVNAAVDLLFFVFFYASYFLFAIDAVCLFVVELAACLVGWVLYFFLNKFVRIRTALW